MKGIRYILYICFYGQKQSSVYNVWSTLQNHGARLYLYGSCYSSENAPLQYLAPYRMCDGEYFEMKDIRLNCIWWSYKHAAAYRQMSLLFDVLQEEKLILEIFSIFTLVSRTCCKLNDDSVVEALQHCL
jgi:F0F1-type ATP synthase alpha subunit